MEMRFNLDSCTALVISDRPIPDPRPQCAQGGSYDGVNLQVVHTPLQLPPMGNESSMTFTVVPDQVFNVTLKPSEARTIASALMTAAQSVR